jgi:hypothetical protein
MLAAPRTLPPLSARRLFYNFNMETDMLDASTFNYHQPTMNDARVAAAMYASHLADMLPDGPDKTHIMRELRTVAMWVNVCITRHADGSPRQD